MAPDRHIVSWRVELPPDCSLRIASSLCSTPVIRYCVNQMAAGEQRAREFYAVLGAGERNPLFAALSQQQARALVGIQSLRISLCGLRIYERHR